MKYMLDTNMCIYAMKNQYIGLREYMAEIPPLEICISTITLFELKHGVYKSAATHNTKEFSRVDNLKVEDWVEKLASKFE